MGKADAVEISADNPTAYPCHVAPLTERTKEHGGSSF